MAENPTGPAGKVQQVDLRAAQMHLEYLVQRALLQPPDHGAIRVDLGREALVVVVSPRLVALDVGQGSSRMLHVQPELESRPRNQCKSTSACRQPSACSLPLRSRVSRVNAGVMPVVMRRSAATSNPSGADSLYAARNRCARRCRRRSGQGPKIRRWNRLIRNTARSISGGPKSPVKPVQSALDQSMIVRLPASGDQKTFRIPKSPCSGTGCLFVSAPGSD